MRISTKGRYALRLMIDLAMNESKEPVRVRDVAERQGISVKYLEQIIAILNKGGFVKSIRGPQGGYRLVKEPSAYTVGEILRLIEGNLSPVPCLDDGVNQCERSNACCTLYLWRKLDDAMNSVLDTVTLQEMVDNTPKKKECVLD